MTGSGHDLRESSFHALHVDPEMPDHMPYHTYLNFWIPFTVSGAHSLVGATIESDSDVMRLALRRMSRSASPQHV